MARMSPNEQAEILKDQGNFYFKKEKLGAAIEAYTQVFTFYLPILGQFYLKTFSVPFATDYSERWKF